MSVLCLAERDGDQIAAASLAALSFARALVPAGDVTVVVAETAPVAPGLAAGVAAQVCHVVTPGLSGYAPAAWARALQQLAAARGAVAVVAAATDRGSEVLAHLGAMTGLPVAANCVSASREGPSSWRLVRQRWAGSVLEDAVLDAPVALLTIAADAAQSAAADAGGPAAADASGSADGVAAGQAVVPAVVPAAVTSFTPELTAADLLVQARESGDAEQGMSLASARVVVGGGRGVGGPDGFAALEELAALLGGAVGVSRVVTSAGWRPHRQQVGQTGTKIAPELYLACGISGAIQHMAGCQGARCLIVVNTDPDAPIVSRADYAVIADLHEVLPALVAAIKSRLS
jgi:electron transfer flavoprotein alpha subunit